MPNISYTVKRGDTLLSIARRYGSTVEKIVQANNIANPNLILPGTVLIIPVEVMEPPAGPPPGELIYTVQPGDTLSKIASLFQVTVRSIVELNNISDPNRIFPGTKLLLPENAINPFRPGLIEYTILPGDTLYSIARRFGTTVSELDRINNVDPYTLQIGQVIRIPIPENAVAIYRGSPNKMQVALTFDATYGDNQTPILLDILRRNNIKATFFLSGIWLENFPELARSITREGHEIGNHSYTHPHLTQIPISEVRDQIINTERIIESVTGRSPYLFRPPFGEFNQEVLNTVADLGYLIIMWTIDTLDWRSPGVQVIIDRVVNNIKPGAIILMHQAATQTPQALQSIITQLRSKGYYFGTVTEVLNP